MGEFAPHDLTSNTSHSPFVVSASSNAPYWLPWMAFSNSVDPSEGWIHAAGAFPSWLKINLGDINWDDSEAIIWDLALDNWDNILSRILIAYAIKIVLTYGDTAERAPKDWTIQGSNNNSTWTTIDTVAGETNWVSETRFFICDVQTTAYKYFRIVPTANNGNAYYTEITELYLYDEGVSFGGNSYTFSELGAIDVLNPSNSDYSFSIAGSVDILNTSNLNFIFSMLSGGGIFQDVGNLNFSFSSAGTILIQQNTGSPTFKLVISGSGIVLNPSYLSGGPTFRFSINGNSTQNIEATLGSLEFIFSIQGQTQQEVGNNNYLRQFINDNPITPANGVYTAPSDPTGFDDELEYLKDFMGMG